MSTTRPSLEDLRQMLTELGQQRRLYELQLRETDSRIAIVEAAIRCRLKEKTDETRPA